MECDICEADGVKLYEAESSKNLCDYCMVSYEYRHPMSPASSKSMSMFFQVLEKNIKDHINLGRDME